MRPQIEIPIVLPKTGEEFVYMPEEIIFVREAKG